MQVTIGLINVMHSHARSEFEGCQFCSGETFDAVREQPVIRRAILTGGHHKEKCMKSLIHSFSRYDDEKGACAIPIFLSQLGFAEARARMTGRQ